MDKQLDYFQEEQIDIKEYIVKLLRYWYIYPVCLAIAFIIAFFYIKTKTPLYEVEATLLIQDEQSLMDPEAVLKAEALTSSSFLYQYKLQNEVQVLKSYNLCQQTVKELGFEVSYYIDEKFIVRDIYKNTPFIVYIDTFHVQPIGIRIYVKPMNHNRLLISGEGEQISLYRYSNETINHRLGTLSFKDTIKIGEKYSKSFAQFTIQLNPEMKFDDKEYFFVFGSYESLARRYSQFGIEEVKYSSVIKIVSTGANVSKAIDFQNKLIDSYLNRGVHKKNRIAINTIDFIDAQLETISDSLKKVELELREFRSEERVMNIDFKAQQNYEKLAELQSDKASLILNLKYYEYLKSYLSADEEIQEFVVPSSMGINDPLLNKLIIELTNSYTEKAEIMANARKDNPYLESVNHKIENQKNNLRENVDNLINQTNISIKDIDERLDDISLEVQHLPETQRQLLNIEREFELQNDLYTYLMRKKSEMEIAKASNLPNHEVLDYPRLAKNFPISPNRKIIYILSFLLGLGLPVSIVLLIDYFNDKVLDSKDIEQVTDYPVLGNILRSREEGTMIVHQHPRSVISEAFRSIRTNFQFIQGAVQNPIILISSSMMGEGKSFISLNLATSFALFKKRVLILSFDLRKPTLTKLLEVDWKEGLSTYLSNNCEIEDIICKTKIDNLSVIPSGTIPPNPSELIASNRTSDLFKYLKQHYDYIVVDTPPVGIVADALLLMNHTDINLFIVRHNYTSKKMLNSVIKSLEQKKIKHINIVVNDINLTGRKYDYSYGYGYGYGYEYSS